MGVVVHKGNNFLVTSYVLTTGPKANQNPSITWCSDLRITANQIIFHTFQEKAHGLHTRLSTVNHRRPFSDFYWGEWGGGGGSLGFNSGQSTQRKSEIHSCRKQTTGSNCTICMKLKASWNLNIRLRAAKVRFTQSEFRILYALHNLGERKKRRKKVTLGSRFTLSRGPQAYELCLVNTLFQISLCIYHPGI